MSYQTQRHSEVRAVLGLFGLLLLACHQPQEAPPATPDAAVVVGAGVGAPVDAGVAAAPVVLEAQFALLDGGVTTLPFVARGERATIDPTSAITVTANQRISNFRVRLMDDSDHAVPSDDSFADDAPALRYQLGLQSPLKTGHRYALLLDAQTGAAALDAAGRPVSDIRLELQISGEREKPQPPSKKKKPKRR